MANTEMQESVGSRVAILASAGRDGGSVCDGMNEVKPAATAQPLGDRSAHRWKDGMAVDDTVLMVGLFAFGIVILCVMLALIYARNDDD